jgi:hypothetical protein
MRTYCVDIVSPGTSRYDTYNDTIVRYNTYHDMVAIFCPVRIRVRIDLPHPLVCRKRRLNGAVLRIRPKKPRPPCHDRCDTIKIPPCSKALSAEHRPIFCSPSPVMVTSPYKWKILERDVKPSIINQSIFIFFYCQILWCLVAYLKK